MQDKIEYLENEVSELKEMLLVALREFGWKGTKEEIFATLRAKAGLNNEIPKGISN